MPTETNQSNFTEVVPAALPSAGYAIYPIMPAMTAEKEAEEPSLPLSHYLWILRRNRWRILGFVFGCVLATLVISVRLTPVYESTATIDVDRQMPPGIVGQDATRALSNDADQFLATQTKLIQSDSVLRPVVRRYGLVKHENLQSGGNSARSAKAENAPITLNKLKVFRPPSTYLLLVSYQSPDPQLAANVANDIAHSYIQHTYDLRFQASSSLSDFMEKQLETLKAKMERSTGALAQFERELNVINPEEKTSILSSRLLQLNTEYTNAQADRMRKEASVRSLQTGSLEAALASQQGESLRKLAEHLSDVQEKFAQVKGQYGTSHPEYLKAATQIAELDAQVTRLRETIAQRVAAELAEAQSREQMLGLAVASTKVEFDRLNARSFEYQQLKREAEATRGLYEELVRRIREAGINAGFQNSSIRLADAARPADTPVFPNIPLNLVLALAFSAVLAIGAAVLSDVLDDTIRDPEQVRRSLNTDVIGSLPLVKSWWRNLRPVPSRSVQPAGVAGQQGIIPSPIFSDSALAGFGEAVRTLRNSILLGSTGRQLRTLLLTSATPGEGKTTTAVHLAIAHAEQQHKTLLIDADLRRPGVPRALGWSGGEAGLANALSDHMVWRDKLMSIEGVPFLDILPAGAVNRRTVDLLGPNLAQLLADAGPDYELIILDAPPLLGFPEPLQIAAAVDGVIVVSRAGRTNRKAIATVLSTLKRVRANVVGLVLNEVNGDMSDSYHYYGYYGKQYKYYKQYGERRGN